MKIDGKTRFAGVIGWPVNHSLSPVIHNHWCKKYGIDAVYLPLPVQPENLSEVIPALAKMGCVGVNLTIPHKELVLPLIDAVDDVALRVGAVNTIDFKSGKYWGYNTDAYGFWHNIEENTRDLRKDTALVIGAGGAARAVVCALHDAGFQHILIMNRTREKAEILCKLSSQAKVIEWDIATNALEKADFIVNTTSLGMKGEQPLTLALEKCKDNCLVTDIVYTPIATPLLQQAEERGLATINGLGMLLYQAQKAFHHWFGILPDVDETLRRLVLIKE